MSIIEGPVRVGAYSDSDDHPGWMIDDAGGTTIAIVEYRERADLIVLAVNVYSLNAFNDPHHPTRGERPMKYTIRFRDAQKTEAIEAEKLEEVHSSYHFSTNGTVRAMVPRDVVLSVTSTDGASDA